jgi:hypothetical protein
LKYAEVNGIEVKHSSCSMRIEMIAGFGMVGASVQASGGQYFRISCRAVELVLFFKIKTD